MDVREIEQIRKKVESINKEVGERSARLKLLKDQLSEKMNELKELGISTIAEADEHMKSLETEYAEIKEKLEKAIKDVESQLVTQEEAF